MSDVKYICTVTSDGHIRTMRVALKSNFPEEGYNSESGLTTIHIRDDITDHGKFILENYYDFSSSSFQTRDPQPNSIAIWENGAWTWYHEDFLNLVRTQRDRRLYACDWTQLPDSPLSDEDKELWRTYRQQLRDITNDLSGISSLDEITWPESPINT